VKRFCSLLHIDISITSEPGKTTVARLALPEEEANSFFEALLLQVENGKKQTPKVFNPDNPVQAEGAVRGRDAACHVSTTGTPKEFNPLRG
jgi:hypothetical protein